MKPTSKDEPLDFMPAFLDNEATAPGIFLGINTYLRIYRYLEITFNFRVLLNYKKKKEKSKLAFLSHFLRAWFLESSLHREGIHLHLLTPFIHFPPSIIYLLALMIFPGYRDYLTLMANGEVEENKTTKEGEGEEEEGNEDKDEIDPWTFNEQNRFNLQSLYKDTETTADRVNSIIPSSPSFFPSFSVIFSIISSSFFRRLGQRLQTVPPKHLGETHEGVQTLHSRLPHM